MNNYHLTKASDTWQLKAEGAQTASKTFPTKGIAIAQCGEFFEGKTVSLKIHREDGTIEEERTYPRSADPVHTLG